MEVASLTGTPEYAEKMEAFQEKVRQDLSQENLRKYVDQLRPSPQTENPQDPTQKVSEEPVGPPLTSLSDFPRQD